MKGVKLIGGNELAFTSDFEISKVISRLKQRVEDLDPNWRLSRNRRFYTQCLEIETEVCYLQREIMWRRKRIECHKDYMKRFKSFRR